MNPGIEAVLKELRIRFQNLYGERLVKMLLYGSQARGDADPASDIDVLVVLRGQVSPGEEIARTAEATAELSLKYDGVISCVFVSEKRYTNEQSPLLVNVRREGVPV
jgi:predicted nucleotidyltransferase